MTTLELKGIGTAVKFGNGVCVLNTTPHSLTIRKRCKRPTKDSFT